MKRILLALVFFNISCAHTTGFDGNINIMTSSGRLKPIKELKLGEEVACHDKNFERVSGIVKCVFSYIANGTVEITTQDNIVISAELAERFFLPKEEQWVCAKDLKKGDFLLNEDFDHIAITSVQRIDEPKEMFGVTIDKHHNLIISKGRYIAHNGATGAVVGVYAGQAIGCLILGGFATLVITIGGPVGALAVTAASFSPPLAAAAKGFIVFTSLVGGLGGAIATGPI